MDKIEHEFESYIPSEIINDVWQKDRQEVYDELKTQYAMENPPEWYVKDYWRQLITAEWRRGFDWEFLWKRSGRPASENLDVKTIVECSKVHLDDCFKRSYAFCDLMSAKQLYCDNCHEPIIACVSTTYCARCYRDTLNKWRPI